MIPYMNCACREVKEETGLDIHKHINHSKIITRYVNNCMVYMFVIDNIVIKGNQKFIPIVKNEIEDISWHTFNNNLKSKLYTILVRNIYNKFFHETCDGNLKLDNNILTKLSRVCPNLQTT